MQVKAAILEKVARKEEPHGIIRNGTNAVLDEKDLLPSMDGLDALCNRTGFNIEAKFGFLRVAVTNTPPVATFAMYCWVSNYAQLLQAVRKSTVELTLFIQVRRKKRLQT